ncbi:MAG: 1-acyl-sn-glycerol-3-phosphate acyltransferase [Firmicutes bacterium]|nr:1-acyl-sn-glycerol-3-phosphate acyltransferase [Bacillota bacterium]
MADKHNTKKKKQWIWPRHRFIFDLFRVVGGPIVRWMYNIKTEPFKEQGDRPYLILMNHQTPFDQFFVVMSIKGPIYFIATEDIFSKGWISSVIRYLVNPIPIKKQTTDISAVMNCLRVAKEGGTIALAPEGNRTYSGELCHMNPAILSLAKRLKMPVILYRIEGGYGVQPRWSDKRRKGPMRSYVSRVIEPEELAKLSNEELMAVIREGLDSKEYEMKERYRSERRAEYMERAVYVCPYCGLSKFESHGSETECLTCHRKI